MLVGLLSVVPTYSRSTMETPEQCVKSLQSFSGISAADFEQ